MFDMCGKSLETDRRHTWYFLDDWLEEVPGYQEGTDVLAWDKDDVRAAHRIYLYEDNGCHYVTSRANGSTWFTYCIPYDEELFHMKLADWPAEKRKAGGMI